MEHPAVAQAVTFSLPHRTLGEDMATAVVLEERRQDHAEELREFCHCARLAAHKVPSQVVVLDQIPKGPTGKRNGSAYSARNSGDLKPPTRWSAGEINNRLINRL